MFEVQWENYLEWETIDTSWFRKRAFKKMIKYASRPTAVYNWRIVRKIKEKDYIIAQLELKHELVSVT